MRKIAILPTLLTLGNAVCGFAAITFLSKIEAQRLGVPDHVNFAYAGWFLIGAMLFDALDGYVARLAKSATNFGGQLDSLCDAISFGVAPAFLLLRIGPSAGTLDQPRMPQLHQALSVVATLYMVCALLRLARFNVENSPDPESHKRFKGLPSPAAAGCIASLGILCGTTADSMGLWQRGGLETSAAFNLHNVRWLVEFFAPVGGLGVALLMVSQVSYTHVTNQFLRGRKPFRRLMQVILAGFLLFLMRELAVVLIFWGYTLFFLGRAAWLRLRPAAEVLPPGPAAPPAVKAEPPRDSLEWAADVHRNN